jgi:hypothetical protein
MTSDGKHPSAAFWATVMVVVALVGYPLGYGPFAGLHNRDALPRWVDEPMGIVYWPVDWLYLNGPKPIAAAILWWSNFWSGWDK